MIERLALAFIAGAFAHHWLAKREQPEDGYTDFEAMLDKLPDYIVFAIEAHFDGEPEPMITQTPIDYEF